MTRKILPGIDLIQVIAQWTSENIDSKQPITQAENRSIRIKPMNQL